MISGRKRITFPSKIRSGTKTTLTISQANRRISQTINGINKKTPTKMRQTINGINKKTPTRLNLPIKLTNRKTQMRSLNKKISPIM